MRFILCVSVLPKCTISMQQRVDQKRASDSLELGLQVTVSLCVSDWTTPMSPAEAASTL